MQEFVFLVSSGPKQVSAAVFLCLLSVGQKTLLKLLIVTAPSGSLFMWHGHAVDVIQKQKCGSILCLFKGLACKDCCSPAQCGLLKLNTEILSGLRELGFST